MFGAHRFYLGKAGSGAAQLGLLLLGTVLSIIGVSLVLLFGLGVWVLVDALLIPGIVRQHNLTLIDRM